jgi:hypothetical protein
MKVYQLQLWATISYTPGGVCLEVGKTFANREDADKELDKLNKKLSREYDEDEEFRGFELDCEPNWYIEEIKIK